VTPGRIASSWSVPSRASYPAAVQNRRVLA
jgi:hypothetical protein